MSKQEELLKILKKKKNLSDEQIQELKKIAELTGREFREVVIEKNLLDQEEVAEAEARFYNLPYINLADKKVDGEVLNIFPREVAENYQMVCFEKKGNSIKVGIIDPENFKAIEAVNFLAKEEKLKVQYYIISKASFKKVINQYQSFKDEIYSALETKSKEDEGLQKIKGEDEEVLGDVIKTAPVTKIVSVIIRHAVEGRASDIHIEPFRKESRVRYRIDGVLHTSLVLPRAIHNALIARIKVMAKLKLDETRLPQDGRISLLLNEKIIDFRVSILPLVGTEKAVLRVLDTTQGPPKLEELGYTGRALKIAHDNTKKTSGLLLVTGPTGSGKSTTLFSLLNLINSEGVNICTLEDPVEYFIKGVNQSQVRPEIGFSFANGLRSILRQDPDVVMVGEIRDNETAELAIHAGLTGHFVLSTLHTNNAIGAIPRLMDMKVEPFLLGSTLNAVIAQRLTRKICPHCKEEEKLPKDILEDIKKEIDAMPEKIIKDELGDFDLSSAIFFKGKGCGRCANSGYSGRIAIVEAIDINEELKNFITGEQKSLHLKDVKANQDFVTMKQDGIIKVLKGLTTMEEVLRVIRI